MSLFHNSLLIPILNLKDNVLPTFHNQWVLIVYTPNTAHDTMQSIIIEKSIMVYII